MSIKSLNRQDLFNVGSNLLKAGTALGIGLCVTAPTIKACYAILNRCLKPGAGIATEQTIKNKNVNRYNLYANLINFGAVTAGSLASIVFSRLVSLSPIRSEVTNFAPLLNNSLFTGKKTWYLLGTLGAVAGLIAIPSDDPKRGPGFQSHARRSN